MKKKTKNEEKKAKSKSRTSELRDTSIQSAPDP